MRGADGPGTPPVALAPERELPCGVERGQEGRARGVGGAVDGCPGRVGGGRQEGRDEGGEGRAGWRQLPEGRGARGEGRLCGDTRASKG